MCYVDTILRMALVSYGPLFLNEIPIFDDLGYLTYGLKQQFTWRHQLKVDPYGSLRGYDKRFLNRPTNCPDADEETS